jgi:hypothetical protein
MEINETSCCAMDDIDGLSAFEGKPEEAMIDFCNSVEYTDYGGEKDFKPQNLYLFTGVIKQPSRHGKPEPKYGSEFAAYIRRHKLGRVTPSIAKYNRNNHPDHVRAWVWAVNQESLKEWWNGKRSKS